MQCDLRGSTISQGRFAKALRITFALLRKLDDFLGDEREYWGVATPDDSDDDELDHYSEAEVREQVREAFRARHSAVEQAQREIELWFPGI